MYRILLIFFVALSVTSCDQLLKRMSKRDAQQRAVPESKIVENQARFPDGCNLLSFIEDTTLDLSARKLCAGEHVVPIPLYLYDELETCKPQLRMFYLKAVTNISGYVFDDGIAQKSTETLLDCSNWFFDAAGSSCIENTDLEIWADNVIMLLRKERSQTGVPDKNAATDFVRKFKLMSLIRTAEGREKFKYFEEVLLENWDEYLKNNGVVI